MAGVGAARWMFLDGLGTARWDDALGSLGGLEAWFYPWGEERGTVTADDRVKFATYRRDSESSLDYAGNRYYDNVTGRFMTADPYGGSGVAGNPQSWNRYAYVLGDPVGGNDPWGLIVNVPGQPGGAGLTMGWGSTSCPSFGDPLFDFFDFGNGGGVYGSQGGGCSQFGGYFPIFLFGGGGGGGAFKLSVTGYNRTGANEDTITNDLNDILNQVLTGGCAKWLTGQDFSASQMIAAMENGASGGPSYGYGALNNNSIAAFVGVNNPDGTLIPGLPTDSTITVNTRGAFFNSAYTVGSGFIQYAGGSPQAQIFILIHELAHQVGAAGFLPDAGSQANENSNNALVQKNCGKQIAGAN